MGTMTEHHPVINCHTKAEDGEPPHPSLTDNTAVPHPFSHNTAVPHPFNQSNACAVTNPWGLNCGLRFQGQTDSGMEKRTSIAPKQMLRRWRKETQ